VKILFKFLVSRFWLFLGRYFFVSRMAWVGVVPGLGQYLDGRDSDGQGEEAGDLSGGRGPRDHATGWGSVVGERGKGWVGLRGGGNIMTMESNDPV